MKNAATSLSKQTNVRELKGPVRAIIQLGFQRPLKHFKKGVLKVNAPLYVLKTPDIDNYNTF